MDRLKINCPLCGERMVQSINLEKNSVDYYCSCKGYVEHEEKVIDACFERIIGTDEDDE